MKKPPPTQDAKSCVERLFQHLELGAKYRIKAKTGLHRKLDWASLANLSNAAASHTGKPRTPLISSSKARSRDEHITLSQAQKSVLRDVFLHYCAWCQHVNFVTFMSRSQFLKFARDAGLVGISGHVDMTTLDLLYQRMVRNSSDAAAGMRLTMADWQEALVALSRRVFGFLEPQAAFNRLIEEHVAPLVAEGGAAHPEDPLAEAVLLPEVLQALERARGPLQPVYDYYVMEQEFGDTRASGANWGELVAARTLMPFESFFRLCSDFDVVPALVSKMQLTGTFKAAKFGIQHAAASNDPIRINFQEFLDCLCRIALLAFNYAIPQIPQKHLDFTSSYQSAAKRMWLAESTAMAQEMMEMPDEVLMPEATRDHGIGKEDSPHYDEVMSMKSMKSRATCRSFRSRGVVSRAASMMQTRRREGGDTDVLQVHDDSFQRPDRPLHLRSFTPAWVGQPGLALSEAARLRPARVDPWVAAGIYHSEVGLPPTYHQRMDRMIGARIEREQRYECMHLQMRAERRFESQQRQQRKAQHREGLQDASGQAAARSRMVLQSAPPGTMTGGVSMGSPPRGRSRTHAAVADGASGRYGMRSLSASPSTSPSPTLLHELQDTLDVESKLHTTVLMGRGTIRFG